MRRRHVTALALLAVLSLLTAACGARLSPALRQQAADAVLNGGGGGGGIGSGSTVGSGTGAGAAGIGGAALGSAGTSGGFATTAGGGATGGGATGGSSGKGSARTGGATTSAGNGCPTSGSDVGLTAKQIDLGTVASLTGPVSGLFQGAAQGMQAWEDYVNSTGGLCGRQVHVDIADDGTNCSQNQNDTQTLAEKDFALVGSFSLYDGCGAQYLSQHTNVPDLHDALDPAAGAIPNNFSVEPGALGYATGMFAFYAQLLGSDVKAVGTLYPNIPSAIEKEQAFEKAATSQGWQFVYKRAEDATETDWTSDFVKMCGQDHIKIFFTGAENAENAAKMVQDESQAGCPKSLINIIPIAYDQAFVQDVGNTSAINGMYGWNEYSLFFNTNEARNIPELQLLQTWFARANPGQPLNLYALFAWAEARMFQQAFTSAGPTINRGTLMAALRKMTNFSDGGIVAPSTPSSKSTGVTCYVLWRFENGSFQRFSDPPSGYRCDGQYVTVSG